MTSLSNHIGMIPLEIAEKKENKAIMELLMVKAEGRKVD